MDPWIIKTSDEKKAAVKETVTHVTIKSTLRKKMWFVVILAI